MPSETELSDLIPGIHRRLSTSTPNGSAAGRGANEGSVFDSIPRRLIKKYGLGDQPDKRHALFNQLEKLHRKYGEIVLELISEAVAAAAQARRPDRYFCTAIRKKIVRAGLTLGEASEAQW